MLLLIRVAGVLRAVPADFVVREAVRPCTGHQPINYRAPIDKQLFTLTLTNNQQKTHKRKRKNMHTLHKNAGIEF